MPVELVEVARPYAEAAHKHARAAKQAGAWQEMLDHLAKTVEAGVIHAMLDDPRVSPEGARAVLDEIVRRIGKGHAKQAQAFGNFCHQLLANGRIEAAPEIAAKFKELHHESEQLLDVEIRSAFKLDAKTIDAIKAKLKAKHGASAVEATVTIDESLIGGIMIIAGDSVIDGTVQGELAQMQTTLARTA